MDVYENDKSLSVWLAKYRLLGDDSIANTRSVSVSRRCRNPCGGVTNQRDERYVRSQDHYTESRTVSIVGPSGQCCMSAGCSFGGEGVSTCRESM